MANLEIKIGAKDTASGVMDKLKSKLGSFGGMFGKLAGGIAGIFGVTMATDTLKEWISGLAKIGHEATRIGMTTDELQRLKSVASKNKVDPEMLVGGIEKMAMIVDDALQGNDAAIEKFKRMGIAMDELKGKSVYEQFSRIADGIQSMNTAGEKTALARDMFGKLGGKLVELTGNFRELGAEFDKSGRMIDADTIEQAEKFERTMKSLGGTFKAAFLNSGVVEYLADAAEGLKKLESLSKQIDKTNVKGQYGNKALNTIQQFNEHIGLGFLNNTTGEVLRLDAPSKDEVIGKRNKRLMDSGIKEDAAAKAAEVKQSYADRDYNKAIENLRSQVSYQDTITEGKKDIAEAQKIINELEAKGNKLTFEQMSNIFSLTAAKQAELDKAERIKNESDVRKSIAEQITALDEKRKAQDLINSGMQKEAFIQEQITQARKAATDKGTTTTADELAKITAGASALYDSQQMNAFKGAQGAIVNDRFSAVGGMGGKMFSQDSTPKLHLEVAKQTQKAVSTIQQNVATIAANSGNSALRAP